MAAIRFSRRWCFASKALELCRDVNNEKRTRLDNTQGAAAWWRKFATLSISISDVLNPFSPNFPPNFWIFEFQVDVSFFHCLHRGIIRALLTRSTIGGDLLLKLTDASDLTWYWTAKCMPWHQEIKNNTNVKSQKISSCRGSPTKSIWWMYNMQTEF